MRKVPKLVDVTDVGSYVSDVVHRVVRRVMDKYDIDVPCREVEEVVVDACRQFVDAMCVLKGASDNPGAKSISLKRGEDEVLRLHLEREPGDNVH